MNNVKKIVCVVVCFYSLFFISDSLLANDDASRVSRIITELGKEAVTDPSLPGISIAVLKKGEDTPVCAAFGTASIENNIPLTTQSKFKIGSVTKVFTASLIRGLIEEGKLSFDTTIDRFFPEFPNGKIITVRHLLTHTSGIVDMLSLPAVNTNMTKCWSPEELVAMAGAKPLLFQPGTDQKYSNTGFLMLAVISELVSGQSYETQVQQFFVEKLGMKSLVVGSDNAIVSQLAGGYTGTGKAGLRLPIMASIAIAKGTGNLEAKPEDVVRLVNLDRAMKDNFFDTIPLTPHILANGKVAQFESRTGDYTGSFLDGCTLFMFNDPQITLVGKLGSFPGFGTAYFYDQQTKYAVAISVNNEMEIPKAITLGAGIMYSLRK